MNRLSWERGLSAVSLVHSAQAQEIVSDCVRLGLVDEVRQALAAPGATRTAAQTVRDLVYELAGSTNRDLAVDALIHATGIAEFDRRTLKHYARKHGLSHEGFRKHVLAMRRRLGLGGAAC